MQNLRTIHVILVNTCTILGYLAIESEIHLLAVFLPIGSCIKRVKQAKGCHKNMDLQIICATFWNFPACKHREGRSVLCYM